jgi:hypothetical protein
LILILSIFCCYFLILSFVFLAAFSCVYHFFFFESKIFSYFFNFILNFFFLYQADLLVHHVSSVYPRLLTAHKHAHQTLTEAQSAMSDRESAVAIAKRRVDEAIEFEQQQQQQQQQQQREREQNPEEKQKKDSIASPAQQAIAVAADSVAQLDEINSEEFAMPPWFRRQSVLDINKSRGDLLRQKTRPSLSVSLESLNQNYNADISIMSSLLSYPPTPAGKAESVFGEQIEQLTPRKRVTIQSEPILHAEPIVNQVAVETIETVEVFYSILLFSLIFFSSSFFFPFFFIIC